MESEKFFEAKNMYDLQKKINDFLEKTNVVLIDGILRSSSPGGREPRIFYYAKLRYEMAL
ncbi:MAG: hypothetical protein WC303_02970 [Candidatus Paceibacterota bacterium]|jgi:hypothetical protein